MVVIDASVVFKWFVEDEVCHNETKTLLKRHLSHIENLIIPDLLLYEVANAWSTKSTLTPAEVRDNLIHLDAYALTICPVTFSLLQKSSYFAKQYSVSVYDASYAVLAKEKGCDLITADNKFIDRVDLSFTKHINQYIAFGKSSKK